MDRSRYASNSVQSEERILFHNRGSDSKIVRQCWQTAVALVNWSPGSKNPATRARIPGTSLLMGAKKFLTSFALRKMSGILVIVSSSCGKVKSTG